jgi:hypothetical protein
MKIFNIGRIKIYLDAFRNESNLIERQRLRIGIEVKTLITHYSIESDKVITAVSVYFIQIPLVYGKSLTVLWSPQKISSTLPR